ncbi:MAG: 6-phosphofructokinase [Gammaproteobacteria bacterium]|nr:6-phosphofructokinase [Gammaproteobacteria bacterium]
MTKHIGILTAGGDSPGLNAAIRGVCKTAHGSYGMNIIGFRDGFRGLMENRFIRMDSDVVSGVLSVGGTMLGTSRDKPHRMMVGGKMQDMTDVIVENYHANHLDALICLGGGGTQKNALRLMQRGLNIVTLPKTIDRDIAMTDSTFGFDTALGIATDAIDRLHSTAHSHHRIIVVEIMGHRTGWLAMGAGIAGGADVILIPEIAYDVESISQAILTRVRGGKQFSIVAMSEGAMSVEESEAVRAAELRREQAEDKEERKRAKEELSQIFRHYTDRTLSLSKTLEESTGLESRITILGHLQRGGTPSAADRLIASSLGSACVDLIHEGTFGVMVALHGNKPVPVPLEEVAGVRRVIPQDHPWINTARRLGICLGDELRRST